LKQQILINDWHFKLIFKEEVDFLKGALVPQMQAHHLDRFRHLAD
jgi:hypothetical protein